jgi:hypothetical protein
MAKGQNFLADSASKLEKVLIALSWQDPTVSTMVLCGLVAGSIAASLALHLVPTRFVVFWVGAKMFMAVPIADFLVEYRLVTPPPERCTIPKTTGTAMRFLSRIPDRLEIAHRQICEAQKMNGRAASALNFGDPVIDPLAHPLSPPDDIKSKQQKVGRKTGATVAFDAEAVGADGGSGSRGRSVDSPAINGGSVPRSQSCPPIASPRSEFAAKGKRPSVANLQHLKSAGALAGSVEGDGATRSESVPPGDADGSKNAAAVFSPDGSKPRRNSGPKGLSDKKGAKKPRFSLLFGRSEAADTKVVEGSAIPTSAGKQFITQLQADVTVFGFSSNDLGLLICKWALILGVTILLGWLSSSSPPPVVSLSLVGGEEVGAATASAAAAAAAAASGSAVARLGAGGSCVCDGADVSPTHAKLSVPPVFDTAAAEGSSGSSSNITGGGVDPAVDGGRSNSNSNDSSSADDSGLAGWWGWAFGSGSSHTEQALVATQEEQEAVEALALEEAIAERIEGREETGVREEWAVKEGVGRKEQVGLSTGGGQQETDVKAKQEAEVKAKQEAEKQAKQEAEEQAKQAKQAKQEAGEQAKQEEEAKEKAKAEQEAEEEKAKLEAEEEKAKQGTEEKQEGGDAEAGIGADSIGADSTGADNHNTSNCTSSISSNGSCALGSGVNTSTSENGTDKSSDGVGWWGWLGFQDTGNTEQIANVNAESETGDAGTITATTTTTTSSSDGKSESSSGDGGGSSDGDGSGDETSQTSESSTTNDKTNSSPNGSSDSTGDGSDAAAGWFW